MLTRADVRLSRPGSDVVVTVYRDSVSRWRQAWPCSGIPRRAITFRFDRSGDLVDTNAPTRADGSALLALSHDAWEAAQC